MILQQLMIFKSELDYHHKLIMLDNAFMTTKRTWRINEYYYNINVIGPSNVSDTIFWRARLILSKKPIMLASVINAQLSNFVWTNK